MASEVDICNRALSQVRQGSINSLDQTPATVASQQCRLWYAECRDIMLEDSVWNFARRIAAPAVISGGEEFNWRYVYAIPPDCLRINKVIPNIEIIEAPAEGDTDTTSALQITKALEQVIASLPAVNYQVYNNGTTKVLLCNEPAIRIDYRSRITDPNRMPPQFRTALSMFLASFLAVPLAGATEGPKLRAEALTLYQGILDMANINNSNEGQQEPPESEYILARL